MKYTGYRSIENTTREQVFQQSTIMRSIGITMEEQAFQQSAMNDNGEIRFQTLYTTC
jgi:hypothetical protein